MQVKIPLSLKPSTTGIQGFVTNNQKIKILTTQIQILNKITIYFFPYFIYPKSNFFNLKNDPILKKLAQFKKENKTKAKKLFNQIRFQALLLFGFILNTTLLASKLTKKNNKDQIKLMKSSHVQKVDKPQYCKTIRKEHIPSISKKSIPC